MGYSYTSPYTPPDVSPPKLGGLVGQAGKAASGAFQGVAKQATDIAKQITMPNGVQAAKNAYGEFIDNQGNLLNSDGSIYDPTGGKLGNFDAITAANHIGKASLTPTSTLMHALGQGDKLPGGAAGQVLGGQENVEGFGGQLLPKLNTAGGATTKVQKGLATAMGGGKGTHQTEDTSGRPPGTGVGGVAVDAPPPGQPYQSAPGNAPDAPPSVAPVPGGPGTGGPGGTASGWPSTGDAQIDQLMGLYPQTDSVLDRDPTTGAVTGLKSPYQVHQDPNAALAAAQIKTNTDIANSTDSSPYAKAELGRQDLITKNAMDVNQRTGQANEGAAEGNLAMRGGLQSGARERLARDSARGILEGGQGVQSTDQMARANIGINDENQKNVMKAAIPGQDLGLAQYGSGVDMYNTGTMTTGLANDNSNALAKYGTLGDIFGSSKTADAIKGINNTTISGDAQSAIQGSNPIAGKIPSTGNGAIDKWTGAGLTDPSNRQSSPGFNPYADPGAGNGIPFETDDSSIGAAANRPSFSLTGAGGFPPQKQQAPTFNPSRGY